MSKKMWKSLMQLLFFSIFDPKSPISFPGPIPCLLGWDPSSKVEGEVLGTRLRSRNLSFSLVWKERSRFFYQYQESLTYHSPTSPTPSKDIIIYFSLLTVVKLYVNIHLLLLTDALLTFLSVVQKTALIGHTFPTVLIITHFFYQRYTFH